MRRIASALVIVVSLSTFSQCTNDTAPPELPPATREGKNTLGFKVNGEVWLPQEEEGYPDNFPGISTLVFNIGGDLSIDLKANRPGTSFKVSLCGIVGEGAYSLPAQSLRSATFWSNDTTLFEYPGGRWLVRFTRIDTIHHIISGQFEFDLSSQFGEKVEISEGRFDLKY